MVFGRNPGILGLSECTTGSLETFTPSKMGRQMIAKMERARELCIQVEADIRLKTAMKDRLPREPMRNIEIGDEVTFRDHKEKKIRVGVLTGMDGDSIGLVKWCNHERRVPFRELMHLKERRDLLEDGETDIDSAEEIVQEIIPARQVGPKRKKKVEIIPSLTSIQVEREVRERKRLSDELSDDTDHLPKMKVFTESDTDEETIKKRKENSNKLPVNFDIRPKRYRQVKLYMTSGRVITGRVSGTVKTNQNKFWVDDGRTQYIPIDMEDVRDWLYNEEE